MNTIKTDQELFWEGDFGDGYVDRNNDLSFVANNIVLFSKILSRTNNITSYIEFGANVGLNIKALRTLLPYSKDAAVEINCKAVDELKKINNLQVYHNSIIDIELNRQWDMSFIKGVLIHIAPDKLPVVYDQLYNSAQKYICIIEYYNPTPVELDYRGHSNRLFKRDFAGEMLDRYKKLSLVDYGFVWHRDPVFPQDDLTWFLLQKND